jgi:type IV pilus assembly protein PilE
MRKLHNLAARPAGGFTLIELMVVVLIVTILTVIAVPSYLNQTLKSHRSEAKSILMDLAAREERFIATNGVYSTLPSDLGLGPTGTNWPVTVGSNYYQIDAITVQAPAAGTATTAATPATFSITAEAINGQAKDTSCAKFTVTSAGLQTSVNSAAGTSTGCW